MTKLARLYQNPKIEQAVINLFWDAVTLLENRAEIREFLGELLTPTELRMIAKRFAIAKMLDDGYDYQTIRGYLKVTDRTIAFVNNKLNFGDGGFEKTLERISEIEKKRQKRLEGVSDFLKPPAGGVDPFEVIELIGKQLKKRAKRKSVENQTK
jgi:TrpR-related protein YerC/YecD